MTERPLNRRPVWVEEAYVYLASREPPEAPLRQVAEHAMGRVPPGPAWREGQAKRRTDARYRSGVEDIGALETDRIVRSGQKRIILKALHHESKTGRMQKFDREGRRWIRLVRLPE